MPELHVKEGRLPELRLPEISRDEIIRSFSEIKRPDLDISNIEWPKVDLSRIEWNREDLEKAIMGLATAARIVRPAVRSRRLPFALGFIAVASLATFAVLSRPAVRERLARAVSEARRRAMAARARADSLEVEADIPAPAAMADVIAIPVEPDAFNGGAQVVEVAETVPEGSAKTA